MALLLAPGAWAASSYEALQVQVPVSGPGTYEAEAADGTVVPAEDGALSLSFDEPGTYEYTVRDASDATVEPRVLTVYVTSSDADALRLQATSVATVDGNKTTLDFPQPEEPDNPGSSSSSGGSGSNAGGSGGSGDSGSGSQGGGDGSPITGDANGILLWAAVCVACGAAAVVLVARRRKEDER